MRRALWLGIPLAFASGTLAAACSGGGDEPGFTSEGDDAGADAPDGSIVTDAAIAAEADAPAPKHPPVRLTHACDPTLAIDVAVLDDRVVRFHYVKDGARIPDRGWITDEAALDGPTEAIVDDKAGALHVTTAALDVAVTGATCAITIKAKGGGAVLWEEGAPFAKESISKLTIGKKLAPGEKIYGFGEKTGPSARRGRAFTMNNSDPAWSDPSGQYLPTSDPIYQSHPFFVSLAAGHATAGFLANTFATAFDVGKTKDDLLAMSASGGDVDLYFIDGPAPRDVLERYTRLVGRAPMPPMWTLGYHQSRWTYAPSSRVEDVAFEFRRRGLPIDGIWLDIDYMDGFRDFTWSPTAFGDHAGMLKRLADNGFKVTTIVDPGIKSDPGGKYAAYTDGMAKGVFIPGTGGAPVVRPCWPGDAVFPDFSSASARAWWGDELGDFLSAGVRGTWIDMNEPAVFVKEGFPLDAKVDGEGKGTSFAEIKNIYAMLMARATFEGQKKAFPDRRPFLLTRAGFAGIQRYAAVWTGDAQSTWAHLAMAPAMLQGMGVSGIPFVGSDIGGFTGSPSAELYGRWFEVGSLSPFFRTHVATGTPDQEPWSFGPEIEDVARRMLAVRYALLPYWYNAYVETTRTGAPVLRPLWFEFPGDDEAFAHDDEMFIGPSLMAAPVTAAGVTSRAVYLPAGTFYDFYTGAAYTGPTTVQMPAPLGRIPLFVRGGSVIAEQGIVDYVGAAPDAPRYLDVYPGPIGTNAAQSIYEDDGETMAYARGQSATTPVSLAVTAAGLAVTLGARTGAYVPRAAKTELRVHGVPAKPASVTLDGQSAAIAYDPSTRIVTVPLGIGGAAHAIAIAYDGATLPAPREVSLDFAVTLPANSPAGDVYVASSAGAWEPAGTKLTRAGGVATGTLKVLEGTLVRYKLTRGAWTTVEVDASCASLANRSVVAPGGGAAVAIGVAKWTDACP
jgi:alpha-glucosidase